MTLGPRGCLHSTEEMFAFRKIFLSNCASLTQREHLCLQQKFAKQGPQAKPSFLPVFIIKFYWDTVSFISTQSVAAFAQQQSQMVGTEPATPGKLEVFTLWPFIKCLLTPVSNITLLVTLI